MEKPSRPYFADRKRIHCSNLGLRKSVEGTGMVGMRHSELIGRLTAKIDNKKENLQEKSETGGDILSLNQKIKDLQREQINLKRQMVRINDISKANKNAKIAIQIKYESLLKQFDGKESQIYKLSQEVRVMKQLNNCLLKVTENTLCMLPHYENNCEDMLNYISLTKHKLVSEVSEESKDINKVDTLNDLFKKIDVFKSQVDNMQNYQKKMMSNLTQAHLEGKSVTQRLSVVSSLNLEELASLKGEIAVSTQIFKQYDPNDSQIYRSQRNLELYSMICPFTFIPESTPHITKIFTQVCMLFQQHIHLLEVQKMEFQFTKNKKLIACQKFECDICECYEKIVSQTFSIVREAFKEVKFQLLKEIKQISDIDEIPILI